MTLGSTRREAGSRQTEQLLNRTATFQNPASLFPFSEKFLVLAVELAACPGKGTSALFVWSSRGWTVFHPFPSPWEPFVVWSPHTLPLTCFLSLIDPLCSLQFQVRELRRGQEPARWFGCAGSSCGGKLELRRGSAPGLLGPRVQRKA